MDDTPEAPRGAESMSVSEATGSDERMLGGFAGGLGLELTEVSGERVLGRWVGNSRLDDGNAMLHRGACSSVVETVASIGAAVWLGERGKVVGVNNTTEFFGSAAVGDELRVTAVPVFRGPHQQLWAVDIHGAGDVEIARGQVRLQNLTAD